MAGYYPARSYLARNMAPIERDRLGHADLLRLGGYDAVQDARGHAAAEHFAPHPMIAPEIAHAHAERRRSRRER